MRNLNMGSAAPATTQTEIFFPSNIVPEGEKNKEQWMRNWADAITLFAPQCWNYEDNLNFEAARGMVNDGDYAHITNLFGGGVNANGMQKSLPAKLRPVNTIPHMLNKIIGRVEGEGMDFACTVVNEDALTEKLNNLSHKAAKDLTKYVRQQAGVSQTLGRPLYDTDEIQNVNVSELENMNPQTFQQEAEENVTNALYYLLNKKSSFMKYKLSEQALRGYLITGKIGIDTFIECGDPNLEAVDSRFLIYELDSNSPFIHHGRYDGYMSYATPQEIKDRCPELTRKEIEQIDEAFKYWRAQGYKNIPPTTGQYLNGSFYMAMYKLYWKGIARKRFKITPNIFDKDNPHVTFLSEDDYKVWLKREKKPEGEYVEMRETNVVYEDTKIGLDIHYQCRELPGQFQSEDEPGLRELPLVGIVDPNPWPVKLVRPLEELRIECIFTLERLIGQAKGNVIIVDEATEENGVDNVYNMLAFGVYRINTERAGDRENGQPAPMVPQVKDLSLSQSVSQLMQFIAFIDANIELVLGSNDTARGVVKSDQGLGVTQNAVEQAQLTLQPWYTVYYTVAEMALQALCNLMRPAWSGKEKTASFIGDKGYQFFSLKPGTNWFWPNYGVNVVNSIGATRIKNLMIGMAQQYLSTVKEPELVLSIFKMARAHSDAECERVFKEGIKAVRDIQKETQKMEQEAQKQQAQAQAQKNQVDAENDKARAESPVQVATIKEASATEREKMKLKHKEDSSDVDYQNRIRETAAEIIKHESESAIDATHNAMTEQPQTQEA